MIARTGARRHLGGSGRPRDAGSVGPKAGRPAWAIALLVAATLGATPAPAQYQGRISGAEGREDGLALLDPDWLAAVDGAGLVAAIGDDPAGWIAGLQVTPVLSAADGWSCLCARMLQLGEVATLSRWLAALARGPEEAADWLATDSAEAGLPPHFAAAREYGAAVSGCLMALEDQAAHDPVAARTALSEFHTAAGVEAGPDPHPDFGTRALFDRFWPEALDTFGAAREAYASQWRQAGARLHCQTAVRALW